jgi:hypothetical protein
MWLSVTGTLSYGVVRVAEVPNASIRTKVKFAKLGVITAPEQIKITYLSDEIQYNRSRTVSEQGYLFRGQDNPLLCGRKKISTRSDIHTHSSIDLDRFVDIASTRRDCFSKICKDRHKKVIELLLRPRSMQQEKTGQPDNLNSWTPSYIPDRRVYGNRFVGRYWVPCGNADKFTALQDQVGSVLQMGCILTDFQGGSALNLAEFPRNASFSVGTYPCVVGFGQCVASNLCSISGGIGALPGSIRTISGNFCLTYQENIGNDTGQKEQAGEDTHQPIRNALVAFVLSLFCLILALLSFYFAKTAIDDEGLINIWRIALAIMLFSVAHIPGYLSLPLWGL